MALIAIKLFTKNSMGTGVRGTLGNDVNGSLVSHVSLVSTDDTAIVGTGTNQSMSVNGSAIGAVYGILLGNMLGVDDNRVSVGAHGYVFGARLGVVIDGSNAELTNAGTIDSTGSGAEIYVDSATSTSTITNGGSLSGKENSLVLSGGGDFRVTNTGVMVGGLLAGDDVRGHVKVVNKGEMDGAVVLGSGDDTFNGAKGLVKDYTNEAGTIFGGDGNDRMIGGRLTDLLEGETGADILTGNGGADRFIFTSSTDSTVAAGGRDLITDFHHNQHDQIDLQAIEGISSFRGEKGFTGAGGEIRYEFVHGNTLVTADIDGDKHADFALELTGKVHLVNGDFVL